MQIVNIERGKGKTTRLMAISELCGYPILVCNELQKKHTQENAKKYGYNIAEVYSVHDLLSDKQKGKSYLVPFLCDEMPFVFEQLMAELFDTEVMISTMSSKQDISEDTVF